MANHNINADSHLLASRIADNKDFAAACSVGDANRILEIVSSEMRKNNMFTTGAKKLQADIALMLQGKPRVSSFIGNKVLMFVWNSRLSGNGLSVAG